MPQEPFTSEEISLRNQEDRFIQESKKAYERTNRVLAVEYARKERAKKVHAQIPDPDSRAL